MHDPLTLLKVILLMPFACLGALVGGLALARPATWGDTAILGGILALVHVAIGAALRWLWRRSADRRFLGHSAKVWTVLIAISYGLGFGLVAVAGR